MALFGDTDAYNTALGLSGSQYRVPSLAGTAAGQNYYQNTVNFLEDDNARKKANKERQLSLAKTALSLYTGGAFGAASGGGGGGLLGGLGGGGGGGAGGLVGGLLGGGGGGGGAKPDGNSGGWSANAGVTAANNRIYYNNPY